MRQIRKLRVADEIVALIQSMHPDLKRKIRGSLQTILSEPYAGKALRDELSGLRSLRVSRFRVIYSISKKQQIEVVTIGPRDRIYEETFRIISKEAKQPSSG